MADKAIEPGKKSTERYLPEAAWKAMSKAERKKLLQDMCFKYLELNVCVMDFTMVFGSVC